MNYTPSPGIHYTPFPGIFNLLQVIFNVYTTHRLQVYLTFSRYALHIFSRYTQYSPGSHFLTFPSWKLKTKFFLFCAMVLVGQKVLCFKQFKTVNGWLN